MLYTRADIQNAIAMVDLGNGYSTSIRRAAKAYRIPFTTLRGRISGQDWRAVLHQHKQSSAEEKTLTRCITRLTITAFPASPTLVIQMAEEI